MTDSESKIIDVSMSDIKIASNPHTLRSSGIGSCIVITLYDSQKRVGAMAHSMLTEPTSLNNAEINAEKRGKIQRDSALNSASIPRSLRYIEPAIDTMITELIKLGAVKSRLESKLIGGANMFKVFDKNPNSIGIHNAEAAQKKLEKEGIKIVANDTGGSAGRSVTFDLTTGLVEVKTKI